MDKEVIVCRCEDVTREEIRALIRAGFTTPEEIKRLSRCGMGLCQGRTCLRLAAQEIAALTGKSMAEITPWTARPPVLPVPLKQLAEAAEDD